MSGTQTHIASAAGPAHTGSGPQYNYSYVVESVVRRAREQMARAMAEDDLGRLDQLFVEPTGFAAALRVLRSRRTVLLSAPSGSGRRTTGLMLLREREEGAAPRELADTAEDTTGDSAGADFLDPAVVERGDRLLIDLSGTDEARFLKVQRELSSFRSVLHAREALLVVVLPDGHRYLREPELQSLTVEIRRPEPEAVFRRHLRQGDVETTGSELAAPALRTFLSRSSLGEAAALAERVCGLRRTAAQEESFPDWLHAAFAHGGAQDKAAGQVLGRAGSGSERALLLAVAMLEPATPAALARASESLLRHLEHPQETAPRLDRVDLYSRLFDQERRHGHVAEVAEAPDGSVAFRDSGLAPAVRQHFWTYFPDLRSALRDWVGAELSDWHYSDTERVRFLDSFAEQCLRVGRYDDLVRLAQKWASHAGRGAVGDIVQALTRGLMDTRHGGHLRRQVYAWATDPSCPATLREAVTVVSEQVMALRHPDQALVRLHHVVRRTEGPAREEPLRALLRVAGRQERLRGQLLDRVTCRSPSSHSEADTAVFLALVRTRPPVAPLLRRAAYLDGWRTALDLPDSAVEAALDAWFDAAQHDESPEDLLGILAQCRADRPDVRGRLYARAYAWSRGGPGRTGTLSLFYRLLRVSRLAPGGAPRTQGART